ncbi:unnamed protein product, partial [marine sediment metagenome]
QTLIEDNQIVNAVKPTGTGIYIKDNCVATGAVIRRNIIRLTGAGKGIVDNPNKAQRAVVIGNHVFTVDGTGFDVNDALASMNIWNKNGDVTCYPKIDWEQG